MDPPAITTSSSTFGYVCRRCSRCCWHKHIQLNPYEVARLAQAKGQSTGDFRAASTIDGCGTALQQKEDGSCVFLGPQGCEVHADRPLVCRLYPLAHHVRSDGSEYYTTLEGHPQSEGELTNRGTVTDYVVAQGATPFMDAADGYFRWLCHAYDRLGLDLNSLTSDPREDGSDVDLLDMDSTIARHCAATGEAEPTDLEDRLQLHLRVLYNIIDLEDKYAKRSSEEADRSS
jgi:Fe-S-cluster containining protein